jgi:hypothetical protein
MIELQTDSLVFSFPEVHPKATLRIDFQRTLRIPDDGRDYPLPPGLGNFPLRHVDDFHGRVPERWLQHAGIRFCLAGAEPMEMGLAPGGRMRQEIYDDPYDLSDWATGHSSRCFAHIANSMVWRGITGQQPPTVPPTAADYDRRGLPWFEYYGDAGSAVTGPSVLRGLKSIFQIGNSKGDVPLPENESTAADKVIHLRRGMQPGQVREGNF